MKQTKKLTRTQREFLLKKKIDITGVRVVDDTKGSLTYLTKEGKKCVIYK